MQRQEDQPSYVGCFLEDPYSPDLTGEPPLNITRVEACFTHCSTGTWSYAAIRNGTICTCGDTYSKYGVAPASACSAACPEEQSVFENCGGPNTNVIYSVSLVIQEPVIPAPTHPDGNGSDGGENGTSGYSKTSRTAAISSTAVAVAMLAIGIMSLMVYRKRRSRYSMSSSGGAGFSIGSLKDEEMDDVQRAATGHSWFMVGGGGRRHDDDDDNYGLDKQAYGSSYRSGHSDYKRDMDTELFEGFESSVMLEDHNHSHGEQLVRQTDETTGRNHHQQGHRQGRKSIDTSSSRATSTLSHGAHAPLSQEPAYVSTTAVASPTTSQKLSSILASKIGSTLRHLRVKTRPLQPPPPHLPSLPLSMPSSLTSPGNIPRKPRMSMSSRSPVSTASIATSTMSESDPPAPSWPTLSHREGLDCYDASRDPASATPSFSLTSAPIPGPVSNRQGSSSGTPLDIIAALPSLERYKSISSIISTSSSSSSPVPRAHEGRDGIRNRDQLYKPPPPISQMRSFASLPVVPPAAQTILQNSRHQKEYRSNLIKDLILQGDSVLEEKEIAMMAQYQPYHCLQQKQQQQQQRQKQKQQQQQPRQPHSRHGTLSISNSSTTTSKIPKSSKADPKAIAPAALTEDYRLSSSSALVPTPIPTLSTQGRHNIPSTHTTTVDTNFLAPPPRILIHKAL